MYSSGSYTADGIAEIGSTSIGTSFFDSSASFNNKQPFEFDGAVAWVSPRAEIEVDVQAYTPISPYALISSGQPIVTYGAGVGSAPVIGTQPFNGFASQFRGIANVSAGGHVVLTKSGVWRLHFGGRSDVSPVADSDQVFTKVNLYRWSAGLSGTKGRFQFTGGLNYRSGSSDDVIVRDLQNGDLIRSDIRIRTVGLIYALSYRF